MHIISRRALTLFARQHSDAASWLEQLWRIARRAEWTSLHDVRHDYQAADQVGECLVFNVRGNTYRLICGVRYATEDRQGALFVKRLLTHAEYDKNEWRKDC